MRKHFLFAPVLVLSIACGSSGYLKTDVLEPDHLNPPIAEGVKIQGEMMTDGTLTYQGKGDVNKAYLDYVDAMRSVGWEPRAAEGDSAKGMRCTMKKDTRQVELAVTAEPEGVIKVVIQVGPAK